MNKPDFKKKLIDSLLDDNGQIKPDNELENVISGFDFSSGFRERVLSSIPEQGFIIARQFEFLKGLNLAFSRIALTGVAAIILLLLSIFLMEGSFNFNTILGLSNDYDENIISLLTGNY